MRLKQRDAFFKSLLNNSEFEESIEAINQHVKPEDYSYEEKSLTRKRKRKDKDTAFKINTNQFFAFLGLERRQSSRIKNLSPTFFSEDALDDDSPVKKHLSYDDFDIENLEKPIYKIRQKRHKFSSNNKTPRPPIIPVEDVTKFMIDNISWKVSNKIYSSEGTSCHQCRQKTADQKTCCRNINCVGIRGQFCGICLENR